MPEVSDDTPNGKTPEYCGACARCLPSEQLVRRMVLCVKCGNKRCPHATDHRNDCTNSNEPGQPGSDY